MANKAMIEGDERSQAKALAENQRVAADPVAAKDLLMKTSMIQVLRDTEQVQ